MIKHLTMLPQISQDVKNQLINQITIKKKNEKKKKYVEKKKYV